MTYGADTLTLLERALEQTAAIIAAIPDGQAGLATPGPDWDVSTLVRHLVGQDLRNFLVVARGDAADGQAPGDELGEDRAAALAGHALAWSHRTLRPEFRGPDRAFGFEVPVPPDAPAYQRLAGWFGRDPEWTPPGSAASGSPDRGGPGLRCLLILLVGRCHDGRAGRRNGSIRGRPWPPAGVAR